MLRLQLIAFVLLYLSEAAHAAAFTKADAIVVARKICAEEEQALIKGYGDRWHMSAKDWTAELEGGKWVSQGNDRGVFMTVEISRQGKPLSKCKLLTVD